MFVLLSSLIVLIRGVVGDAEWADSGKVVFLGDDDFTTYRETHPQIFVMFYAPWCGHCKSMKPDYAEAASQLEFRIPLVAVDCTQHKKTCEAHKVQGFPTLVYFSSSEDAGEPYSGGRTTTQIVSFLTEKVGDDDNLENVDLETLKIKQLKRIIADRGESCDGCTEKKEFVARAKEVIHLPKTGGKKKEKAAAPKKTGSTLRNGMTFMEERRYKEAKQVAEEGWGEENGDVVHTISQEFDDFKSKNSKFLVMFYAPWCGHCKNMKPHFAAASTALKGEVPLVAIDCVSNPAVCSKYGANAYPTFIWFNEKKTKTAAIGGKNGDDIVAWVQQQINPTEAAAPVWEENGAVVHLDQDSFKEHIKKKTKMLVMYYAPWCGHCKSLKPTYAQASEKAAGRVVFAAVDCTEHGSLCERQGAKGYPTLKYYSDAKPQEYQGGRDLDAFMSFVDRQVPEDKTEL